MEPTKPTEEQREHARIHSHVRNVLMNEMGFTRDSIREMMRDIVTETAAKFFKNGDFTKHLEEQIDRQLRTYQYETGTLKKELASMVAAAVAKSVEKQVTEKLHLDFRAELR